MRPDDDFFYNLPAREANPYLMPLEERKRLELLSFARKIVIAFSIGLVVAWVLVQTGWGF